MFGPIGGNKVMITNVSISLDTTFYYKGMSYRAGEGIEGGKTKRSRSEKENGIKSGMWVLKVEDRKMTKKISEFPMTQMSFIQQNPGKQSKVMATNKYKLLGTCCSI